MRWLGEERRAIRECIDVVNPTTQTPGEDLQSRLDTVVRYPLAWVSKKSISSVRPGRNI